MNRFFYECCLCFLLMAFISCKSHSYSSPEEVNNKTIYTLKDSIYYTLFHTENHAYGFDVIKNGKVFIHQPVIPLEEGLNGFPAERTAEAVARLIVSKLKNKDYSLLINKYEIDSLVKIKENIIINTAISETPNHIKTQILSPISFQSKNDSLTATLFSLRDAPVKNLWRSKGIVPFGQRSGGISFSIDNLIFLGGGELKDLDTNDFWCYNTVTNIWTCLAEIPNELGTKGISFAVNGKGYIGLGALGGGQKNFKKAFYEYDFTKNKWSEKASFPGDARVDAASFTINNKGYAGLGYAGHYSDDFYEYDPLKDKWKQIANFVGGPVSSPVGISTGTKGFIVGGDKGSNNQKFVYEYLPRENKWLRRSDLPCYARYNLSGWAIDSNLFIAGAGGAEGGSVRFRDFFLYTISKDKWTTIPDYPISKAGISNLPGSGSYGKIYAGTGFNGIFHNDWNVFEHFFSVRKDTGVYDEGTCYPLKYNGTWKLYQECTSDDCYAGTQINSSQDLGNFCYRSHLTNANEELSLRSGNNKKSIQVLMLPRWYNLSAEKTASKPIGLRLFFTRQEIENLAAQFEKNTGKVFSSNKIKILQYNGNNADLNLLSDNTDLSEYKLISPQLFSYGFRGETIVAEFNVTSLRSSFYLVISMD